MHLIIGLGNPGEKFRGTRHNIGREIVIAAQKHFGLPEFTQKPVLHSLISEGRIGKEKVTLLLPETFVNKSGTAVAPAMRAGKIKLRNLILIHDDVDMLLGRTKLSYARNSGGHKGVESVMRAVKTKNFWRMRVGVQKKRRVPGEDLVLQKFKGDEISIVKKITKKSLTAIEAVARADSERAMNEYNA
ncbi:MAG: aminoacyl-tRNA hydrolase [Candidatus Sungbacteria bacterium]|uniref:Aminoacyl-tRNA hydrolase n=1 Tax=Candidatus Sungiibacteriota bacterium TaxID=2750080 RepID=A0A932YYR1_9BACT|nr:aminoacyl-tRNA hydrolase [Candidatus Sungbacteria bacterium]